MKWWLVVSAVGSGCGARIASPHTEIPTEDATLREDAVATEVPSDGSVILPAWVGAGFGYTCARRHGALRCWGVREEELLGAGAMISRPRPVTVSGLPDGVGVGTGYFHTCAWDPEGAVWCWGGNSHGALGDGTMTDRAAPIAVTGLTGVVDLSAGNYVTCARLRDGSARCWGWNGVGQLGSITTASWGGPTVVPGLVGVAGFAVGGGHTCAWLNDGTARCLGT